MRLHLEIRLSKYLGVQVVIGARRSSDNHLPLCNVNENQKESPKLRMHSIDYLHRK